MGFYGVTDADTPNEGQGREVIYKALRNLNVRQLEAVFTQTLVVGQVLMTTTELLWILSERKER